MFRSFACSVALSLCVLSAIGSTGCSPSTTASNTAQTAEGAADTHSGWWCGEHGVPEEECAQCDKSLVAKFKEAGDWCDKHNRPDSQCFICHPENFDKFASRYEAKYGKKPEMPKE